MAAAAAAASFSTTSGLSSTHRVMAPPSTAGELEAGPLGKYKRTEKIGEGTYGIVYKAQVLRGPEKGSFVAMKLIRLETEDEGVPSTAIREISILRELSHVNIIKLTDVLHVQETLYLVFEYLDEDLKRHLERLPAGTRGLDLPLAKSYIHQLLQVRFFFCLPLLSSYISPLVS